MAMEAAACNSVGGPRVAKKGDMCEAKFKSKWYRARVLQVVDGGKKYKISFVSFSYVPTVRASDIRFS